MKKELENIIRENRAEFDNFQLPEGHMLRFEAKLSAQNRRRKNMLFVSIGAAAAVVVGLALLVIMPKEGDDYFTMPEEVAQMQYYYKNQQQKTINMIEQLLENADPELQAEIRQTLAEMEDEDEKFHNEFRQYYYHNFNESLIAHEATYFRSRQGDLEYLVKLLEK